MKVWVLVKDRYGYEEYEAYSADDVMLFSSNEAALKEACDLYYQEYREVVEQSLYPKRELPRPAFASLEEEFSFYIEYFKDMDFGLFVSIAEKEIKE